MSSATVRRNSADSVSSPRSSLLLGAVWLGLLAILGYYVDRRLSVSGDLRLFMPTPHTRAQHLILEEVSEGPGARLLLVGLAGADQPRLAESSRRLAAALRADHGFRLVANGENRLDAVPDALLPYRYLLSPTLDRERFDASFLRSELIERERDLSSPAADLLEPWVPRDPTLEILKLLQSWQPSQEPPVIEDIWFNRTGNAALLIVETAAPAFDPQGQRAALERLRQHFTATRAAPTVRLEVTGPGAFSVLMQQRTERDARVAAVLDTTGMIVLMLLAYRSLVCVLLGALPLASAGVVALAVVTALFGTVHGITIAFGFTLIGVALDYPIFLFSHRVPGVTPLATARSVWPTLAIAVGGLCIAYIAFLVSGVAGLAQLACFNIAGLATAGLCTRYLLPHLLPVATRDYGELALPRRLGAWAARLPHPSWLAPALCVVGIAMLVLIRGDFWDNDLGHLTPVPRPLLLQYESLREQLGTPDIRYLLAIDGRTADEVLTREEQLSAPLGALVGEKAIVGFDDAARYLPSIATQERRRAALPDAAQLQSALAQASAGLAFRPGLFAPFLQDVARARQLPPLTPPMLAGTPLELAIGSLLMQREGRFTGLVTFSEVRDPAALERFAAASHGAIAVLDLKEEAESLVARQRQRIVWCVLVAAILLGAVVYGALRSGIRAVRVLTPMLLTSLLTVAILHAAGVPLSLFHVIALVLAAGLGLDYGLFFERSAHDPSGQRRTLHALLVCAAAALVVFSVLASSALPVLQSIGVTVVMGVIGNFVLALVLIPREERSRAHP